MREHHTHENTPSEQGLTPGSSQQPTLTLYSPRIVNNGEKVKLVCAYSTPQGEDELWYEVSQEYAQYLNAQTADAFILPTLLIAMRHGWQLRVEADISDMLARAVCGDLQFILSVQYPLFKKINVHLHSTSSATYTGAWGVATGFSCGVDSITAVKENFYDCDIPSLKLTHLTQINHSQENESGTNWRKNSGRFIDAANLIGLPIIFIGTNLYSRMSAAYIQIHTLLNGSAAHALNGLFKNYFYASTYDYSHIKLSKKNDIAYADPIVLQQISTRSLSFLPTGTKLTRSQKTLQIKDLELSQKFLDVCTKSPTHRINCSLCYKCQRTMMTLDAYGSLGKYRDQFDLSAWKRHGDAYIAKVQQPTDNAFMLDLQQIGHSTGYFKRRERIVRRTQEQKLAKAQAS